MYLIVDAQALQGSMSRHRGIGRFTRNLVRELARIDGLRVEALFTRALPPPDLQDLTLTSAVRWFEPLVPSTPASEEVNARFLGEWLTTLGCDAVLLPSVFEQGAIIPRFGSTRPLVAAIVHDLIPLLFHTHYLRYARSYTEYAGRIQRIAQCDVILADSESTRADVVRLLRWPPHRVTAILGAAEPLPDPPSASAVADVLASLMITRPFVLYVGGYDRRKNLVGAMAAFAHLPAGIRAAHQLVIVCALTPAQRGLLERAARRLGVRDRLTLTGFVDDHALDVLYRTCRLTLFASYYEGLGLPVLEALLRGAPVVASNRSSIPEFTGPGARLADPASPAAMAAAMEQALAEPYADRLEARRRFAETFQWSTSAARTVRAIGDALATPRAARDGRRRIAWVSPLPPTRSGIADYSAELLAHMPDDLAIVLVVGPGAVVDPVLAQRFPVLRANAVAAEHERRPFDLFVYHVGNSASHLYILELMHRYSGLTVLHDLHIGGLALKARDVGSWFGSIAASLDAEQATELAAAVRRGAADDAAIVAQATLNRPVIARSDAVVVHSAWSWSRVRAATDVPVFHVPMGVPADPAAMAADDRALLGLSRDDFIVVTLGEVTAAKRVESLIDAIQSLPPRIRTRTRLFVVGEAPESLALDLARLAVRLGVADRVHFVGRVDLDELGRFGRAADACVQLRYPPRGETSGALLRALSAGSVCIVSDAGSFSEMPSHAALRIPVGRGEVDALRAALVWLHDNPESGLELRRGALAWVAGHHGLRAAAEQYVAAMTLTMTRRAARDGNWLDAASHALHAAAADGQMDDEAFERWARVHLDAAGEVPSQATEGTIEAR